MASRPRDERVELGRRAAAALPDGRVARLALPIAVDWEHAIAAESRLPLVHVGYAPGAAFREQPERMGPEALRRFDVRWVWSWNGAAAAGPAAARFGAHAVEEVAGWDGAFARVERGAGRARLVRLEPERIDLAVEADAPVEVVLGMGWFPRWRAVDGSGRALEVRPVPAYPGSAVRVAAVTAPPGAVSLRADRWLPSDLAGLVCVALGLALVVAGRRAERTPGARAHARRVAVRLAAAARRARRPARAWAALGAAAAIGVAALVSAARPAAGAFPAGGPLPDARVEARRGSAPFVPCQYAPFEGVYRCGDLGRVGLAMIGATRVHPGAWPTVVPTTGVWPSGGPAEFRVTYRRRFEGAYAVATHAPGEADLAFEGGPALRPDDDGEVVTVDGAPAVTLTLRPRDAYFFVALVRVPAAR